jgi:2-furoyl-CoA dehydrogenase large subunit
METISPALATPAAHVGSSMQRLEDEGLLTGRGRYADDLGEKPGTLHAAVLRSPHAHARLLSIDASAALALPGVRTVVTGEDAKAWAAPFVVGVKQPMEHWCVAVDFVRYVGEPVAVVVAEDRYIAEDALELMKVAYEPLPAVVDTQAAATQGAPILHAGVGSNVVSDRSFRYGEPERAFEEAARRVTLKVRYPRNSCTPIECYVVVAEHDPGDGGYDVLSNFQGPFALHPVMALALRVPGSRLRLRMPRDSGGSFGVKQGVFPYVVLMCLAARKAGAPVKWVQDRLEHLMNSSAATGRVTTIAAAVEADGRIVALDYDQMDDVGAYLRAPEPATFYRMHGALTGAYDIRHLKVRNRVVLTNKMPAGLNRGFGGPQVYFALERLVQCVARELGLDPLDVYERNFIRTFPYHAPAGALIDSGDYARALSVAAGELSDLKARREIARAQGRLYGIGYAAIVEPSISNMGYVSTANTPAERAKAGPKGGAITSATVNVDPLGAVSVTIDSVPQGQGHATVCAQVVADALGLQPAQIAVNVELDTQKDAWSIAAGNYSSRFAGAVAGTVHLAAMRVREKLAALAASQLGIARKEVRFENGKVGGLAFNRLAGTFHWSPPAGMAPGLRETVQWSPPQLTPPDDQDRVNSSCVYGFAFDACGIEIDRLTGKVRVDRYLTTHDAGKLLNPALADGQIRGAFAQALGAALMEQFAYGEDGSLLSGTFADYLPPTAMEVPDPVILHMETPSPFTPLGAKGLGEGNSMSTPACIGNAIADALGLAARPEDIVLPMTPARVMALLEPDEPASKAPATAPPGLAMAGTADLSSSPEAVFAVLLDPERLRRVIPGCRALQRVGDNRFRGDVTLGVGVVNVRYAAQVDLSELDPPKSLRLKGRGSGSLGTAEGDGRVMLAPHGTGTRLTYEYRVTVGGRVAAVGARMIEGSARMVLARMFKQLDREAGPGAPASTWAQRLRRLFGR